MVEDRTFSRVEYSMTLGNKGLTVSNKGMLFVVKRSSVQAT